MCHECPPPPPGFNPEIYVQSLLLLAQPNDFFWTPEMIIQVSAFHIRDIHQAKMLIPNEHWEVIGPDDMEEVFRLLTGFHLVLTTELEQRFRRFPNSGALDAAFMEMRSLYKSLITK